MKNTLTKQIRHLLTPLALVAGAVMLPLAPAAAVTTKIGVDCNNGPNFNLVAGSGDIQLPDGNTMYMWGFSLSGQPFQHPAPTLCVNEGATVTINVTNPLPYDVSIIFPGQEGVKANGALAQPQFSGTTITSLTNIVPKNGGSLSYSFVAGKPGTYIYESGTDPENQVRMGLFGALIVHPTMGANFAYNRADTRFTTGEAFSPTYTSDEEFMLLQSDIDPYHHWAVEAAAPTGAAPLFNMTDYHPRYWLVNGRGLPDTLLDNGSSATPSQPYGALPRVHPHDAANHPYPGLIRYLNVGSEDFPFHPHGQNGRVVGQDGDLLQNSAGQDISFEKFVVNSAPSQTYDVTFQWLDDENYNDTTHPVYETACAPGQAGPCVSFDAPPPANLLYGQFYTGSPYLGKMGPLLPGANTLAQCGEYYIISHNHALFQLVTWGGFVNTGPGTFLRVDPPVASQGQPLPGGGTSPVCP